VPQGKVQLMPKQQYLGFKSGARPEQVGDDHHKSTKDRKHRASSCDDSTRERESMPDGVFGKDRIECHERRLLVIGRRTRNGASPWAYGLSAILWQLAGLWIPAKRSRSIAVERMRRASGLNDGF